MQYISNDLNEKKYIVVICLENGIVYLTFNLEE